MRIVLETALNRGEAEYQNFGDVSMLQAAVTLLQEMLPSARIEVLTESPENLKRYCPGARALPRLCRDLWCGESFLFGRFRQLFPSRLAAWLDLVTEAMERRLPVLLRHLVGLRLAVRDDEGIRDDLMAFLDALENADLLLICGAGCFTDSTVEYWDNSILDLLKAAMRRGIPTVMVGQGMGPLDDLKARSRMRSVLPLVDLVSLRGGRGGMELIELVGVPRDKIMTTGDESIEMAYEARVDELGEGLGINLRVAPYANTEKDLIEKLRPVLQDFARSRNAPMVPLPIAVHRWAGDHETIMQLSAGYGEDSDGGAGIDSPMEVIRQAGRCRIVVTGAYHAAVFALAQGIPVVCLAKSPYYEAKFLGLEDQFGIGCETVFLDDPDAYWKLTAAMEKAWESAERVRLPLQQAALRQIEARRLAYSRARELAIAHASRRNRS